MDLSIQCANNIQNFNLNQSHQYYSVNVADVGIVGLNTLWQLVTNGYSSKGLGKCRVEAKMIVLEIVFSFLSAQMNILLKKTLAKWKSILSTYSQNLTLDIYCILGPLLPSTRRQERSSLMAEVTPYPVKVAEGGAELVHLLLADALGVPDQDLGLDLVDGAGDGGQQLLPAHPDVLLSGGFRGHMETRIPPCIKGLLLPNKRC